VSRTWKGKEERREVGEWWKGSRMEGRVE